MSDDPLRAVETLGSELARELGGNLVSVVLFGSAARSGVPAGGTSFNLLVIVRDASTRTLHPAAATIADWVKRGQPAPLIFSEQEWRDSTDVFPIEIEDLRQTRRVLQGRDPLDGIVTTRDDLRRQLERELRVKLLRLRTLYAAAAADGEALQRLLRDSASSFLTLLRASLRLQGTEPAGGPSEVIAQAARVLGIDGDAFAWAAAAYSDRGPRPQPLRPYDPVAARYVDAIERLAAIVNNA